MFTWVRLQEQCYPVPSGYAVFTWVRLQEQCYPVWSGYAVFTWVRLQHLQEQCYPVPSAYAVFTCSRCKTSTTQFHRLKMWFQSLPAVKQCRVSVCWWHPGKTAPHFYFQQPRDLSHTRPEVHGLNMLFILICGTSPSVLEDEVQHRVSDPSCTERKLVDVTEPAVLYAGHTTQTH